MNFVRKIIKRYEIQQRARYMCSFCGKDSSPPGVVKILEQTNNATCLDRAVSNSQAPMTPGLV